LRSGRRAGAASEAFGNAGEGVGGAEARLAEAVGEEAADGRDLRGATGEEHRLDLVGGEVGAVEEGGRTCVQLDQQGAGEMLELRAGDRLVDVDVRFAKLDAGRLRSRQADLRPFDGTKQPVAEVLFYQVVKGLDGRHVVAGVEHPADQLLRRALA